MDPGSVAAAGVTADRDPNKIINYFFFCRCLKFEMSHLVLEGVLTFMTAKNKSK